MLHLIPAPLHRAILRVAHRLRRRWHRLSRRASAGVSVIALGERGDVLLVRHSYGSRRWSLPGGGLGRGEEPEACARREMREELGCELAEVELAGQIDETLYGAPHRSYVFTARFAGEPRADGREIAEIGWFARGDFPPDLVEFARQRLTLAFDQD
jgi:ADP-ribose pyrophosphatase YjhB (NUDIX family)